MRRGGGVLSAALWLALLAAEVDGLGGGAPTQLLPKMLPGFETGELRAAAHMAELGRAQQQQQRHGAGDQLQSSPSRPNDSEGPEARPEQPKKPKLAPIFRCPSVGAFPSADSYAYTHNEDLGFSLFLERRCKWVYFIRHAEAKHNVAEREDPLGTKFLLEEHSGWKFWDAALTPKGKDQCAQLRKELQDMEHYQDWELCVVSPLTRTLETAKLTVGAVRQEGPPLKMIATEMCRERITLCPADSRRPKSILEAEFPEIDFTQVKDEEDVAWRTNKEDDQACKQRGIEFLQWLARRPESCIAVVTHSGFLKRLFEQFGMGTANEDVEELRRRPANCEMRGLVLCAHHEVEGGDDLISDVPMGLYYGR